MTPAEPGFVGLIVLVELGWVLRRGYGCSRARLAEIMLELIGNSNLVIEHADLVAAAAKTANADFADLLLHHVGQLNGCSRTVTFDRSFSAFENVDLLE